MTTMLRKKLIARLGLLVVGFVAGAVVSIALLQGVLHDLDAQNAASDAMMSRVQALGEGVSRLEMAAAVQESPARSTAIRVEAENLRGLLAELDQDHFVTGKDAEGAGACSRAGRLLQPYLAPGVGVEAPRGAAALHGAVADLSNLARKHVAQEQAALSWRLRALIIGLTIAALLMTNVAILVLVRTAGMILKPVGELIEGSRQLARENFAHRIQIDSSDEFQELAQAYNLLAGELAANEEKKVKSLRQLAITLNHELNNVINGIELQLKLLGRRTGRDPALTAYLAEIHDNLERVARTISSLRDVRRIVLTDYVAGERMLDLPRSIADDPAPTPILTVRPASATAAGTVAPDGETR